MILTNHDTQIRGAKQFSAACERNGGPILAVLHHAFADAQTVLEISSGSGQHAVYFARHLPHLTWYTSDLPQNHPSIRAWLAEAQLANLRPPVHLDVDDAPWSLRDHGLEVDTVDAIFAANVLHVLSWSQVCHFFAGVGPLLHAGGHLCVYGPFKVDGAFTSAGDARFDAYLKAQNPTSGLRDIARLNRLALQQHLHPVGDYAMPANNRLLVWKKENTAL